MRLHRVHTDVEAVPNLAGVRSGCRGFTLRVSLFSGNRGSGHVAVEVGGPPRQGDQSRPYHTIRIGVAGD